MGTPQFSTRTLKTLFSSKYEVVCVYTQPPKKSSRGQRVRKSPIHELAESLNLKVKTPQNLKSENEVNFFE